MVFHFGECTPRGTWDGCRVHLLTNIAPPLSVVCWHSTMITHGRKWLQLQMSLIMTQPFDSITSTGSHLCIYPTCFLYIRLCSKLSRRLLLHTASQLCSACLAVTISRWGPVIRSKRTRGSVSRCTERWPHRVRLPSEELALINDSIMWDLQLLDINGCSRC